MTSLYQHSIATILAHQHPGGAYVASPTFRTYAYSWLRDGSFIAHAMDRVGEHASAAAFHRWVGRVLQRHAVKMTDLTARGQAGAVIPLAEQMHTRFTLDGAEAEAEWTNFQLDGYGTWLWALVDHLERTGDRALYATIRPEVERLVVYLRTFWQVPCYDCWEEFGTDIHTATLAALYGGLHALGRYDPTLADATPATIRAFVLEHAVVNGYLAKYLGSTLVDASLIGVATPYGLFAPDHPLMVATITQIEQDLHRGGVRRYVADTYYGGGEWVLLAAWLGWYYAERGMAAQAERLSAWVAAQATTSGHLPEQVCTDCLSPADYQPWIERWGAVATPLLWSHAMYLILSDALGNTVAAEVSQ